MKELWSTLFMAVLTLAVPVLTTYIISLINKLAKHLEAKTKSLKEKDLIEDIAKTVETAVKVVNQTYVDNLKSNDVFTVAAQEEAMAKAIEVCLKTLKPEAITYLQDIYEDVETYLTHLIESEIHKQKQAKLISPKPIDTAPKPVDTASKPVDTAPKPVDTAPKPVDTASKPVDTAPKPIQTEDQAPSTAEKADSDKIPTIDEPLA